MENDKVKTINITGTTNRYMIKKTTYNLEKNKKRIQSIKWNFDNKYYNYDNQLKLLNKMTHALSDEDDAVVQIMKQQINQKINSYKHQDVCKNLHDPLQFVKFEDLLNDMIHTNLLCYYCNCQLQILYDKSRETHQWTVDRINNNLGHNCHNYHIACLECNLKRKRQNDAKFLFTKQLNLTRLN
jgi:RecG-like helicase